MAVLTKQDLTWEAIVLSGHSLGDTVVAVLTKLDLFMRPSVISCHILFTKSKTGLTLCIIHTKPHKQFIGGGGGAG